MNMDTELNQWRGAWQSETVVPADLRRRVARQARFLRIMLAGDILVTVVIGGGTVLLAARQPRPGMLLLAAATWLFIAIAWAFRLTVHRGLWTKPALDTTAYVDLLIRHARAKIAATVFGVCLFAAEIAFCLGWIYRETSPRQPLGQWLLFSCTFIDLVWLGTALFLGFLIWYRRRQRAELNWLLQFRQE
jgi:hypothetical protein